MTMLLDTLRIAGIKTAKIGRAELASQMVRDCLGARNCASVYPRLVFASNGSVIARYHKDPEFRAAFDNADIVDADGMPLIIASRLFYKEPLPERVATTDFIHDAALAASAEGLRFYFLGGREEDNRLAAAFFRDRYPGLQIVGRRNGYFDESDEASICEEIVGLKVDVLWLGLGSPLQEGFAIRNRFRLPGVGWIRTCGGLFDYYSGRRSRAPMWMQKASLEWLYRSLLEPRRLGVRYLQTNIPALFHLFTKSGDRDVRARSPV